MNIPIIARQQAKRCTEKELAYLSHWRNEGYTLTIDDIIPLDTETPPQFATQHPIMDALAGGCIAIIAVLMGCTWLAYGAGLMK